MALLGFERFAAFRLCGWRWRGVEGRMQSGERQKNGVQREAGDEVKDAKWRKRTVVSATIVLCFCVGAGLFANDA